MKTLPRISLAPLALAAACLPTCGVAQTDTPRRVEETRIELLAQNAAAAAETAIEQVMGDGLAIRAGGERVVKGAPYCADAVHETVQWLQEPPGAQAGAGNRIVRKTGTRLCRDGEGRTRQEVESGGRKLVYLADPVARENWVLDPERKTARQLGGHGAFAWSGAWSGGVDSSAWRDYAERMRDWARTMADSVRSGVRSADSTRGTAAAPPAPPVPPAPPTPPTPALVEVPAGPGTREMRVFRFDGPGIVAPPEVRWRSQQLGPRGAPVLSPLPAKEIEGLRVNGERSTWTIEAGKFGNEKPIQITREVWTSPELMLTVHSRDFDPRTGEVSYRLQNVKRGEPDAALMKVPADFKTTRRGERSERGAPRNEPRGEWREERREERRTEERREKS